LREDRALAVIPANAGSAFQRRKPVVHFASSHGKSPMDSRLTSFAVEKLLAGMTP
jgi:hypothetical protein